MEELILLLFFVGLGLSLWEAYKKKGPTIWDKAGVTDANFKRDILVKMARRKQYQPIEFND